jgi:hemerythrin superfamily protein
MATSRPSSRAASAARAKVLESLIEDHKRVKKAYRDFKKLDHHEDAEQAQQLVNQVLMDLQVHTALEEELLYPAIREAIDDTDMLDEAEVEHESAHTLIDQLTVMSPEDDKYMARFTVLCEYVIHHVKEEEGQMFPALEKARMDWPAIADGFDTRREELMAIHAPADALENADGEEDQEQEAEASTAAAPAPAPAPPRKRAARAR